MFRFVGLIAVIFAAHHAYAEPAYYRVTGVASNDTLNVRAEPNASSADIGDLPHDATRIEVGAIDQTGRWGRIIWEEENAWVAMRFLQADNLSMVKSTQLAAGLVCSGTEPFWSFNLGVDTAIFADINGTNLVMSLQSTSIAEGALHFPARLNFSGGPANAAALVRPSDCSDGMSDRTYPWQVDLLLAAGGNNRFLTGCCHLPIDVGNH